MSATATEVGVKERPIIFSGPMVRAVLEGRKTQTRGVITPQPLDSWMSSPKADWSEYYKRVRFGMKKHLWIMHPTENREIVCPYGKPGDRLWVRENWQTTSIETKLGLNRGVKYQADGISMSFSRDLVLSINNRMSNGWKPSIHMPRWASRVTLEITNIRVERVQEIAGADAKAEGVDSFLNRDATAWRAGFQIVWDEINAKRGYSWASNPWVWCVSFKKL